MKDQLGTDALRWQAWDGCPGCAGLGWVSGLCGLCPNIKTTLGMDRLRCKTPAMAEKEIWVYLLAYNLIRLLMAQSAVLADLLPRQLSFKHALPLWVAWLQYQPAIDDSTLNQLCTLIAQRQVGKRPGRIEPRAIKRRPKPFPLLMKPRDLARAHVRKHGHPSKHK
jgi:hypothetical protein